MTVHKDPTQLARSELVKRLRSRIRLEHSLAADQELNEVLPAAEKAFDDLVQRGQLPSLVEVDAIVAEAGK